ncbi:ankyrin repeat protein [Acanthamoeba polyphaga moumouvirus]|uniref:Ankyrin repeat protein n=1 Tax=Acanthamoeba polyphaga moumouvirus TaxID=1269028 RepID=L7RFS4_9VIRU|nr:ankyrin repeat protein [Acanthamoeba polyphaga moumouvirus]AGC01705.1 ankyrin repeat protein [Acanthamoeba polyphaga moumouvirus]AQN68044.1 ankyrin repeat protein [Saudi moumouvirus]
MDQFQDFYKITNAKETHYGFKYEDGLNIMLDTFIKQDVKGKTKISCLHNGLYFTNIQNILRYINHGIFLRKIELPLDDPGFIMERDPIESKWRSNMIILTDKYDLRNTETFDMLIELGADIHIDNDLPLRWATRNGFYNIVEYLLNHGSDPQVLDNEPLILACENGFLDIVKLLVSKGSNICARENNPIRAATRQNHYQIVKYLIDCGADYTSLDNFCLRTASYFKYTEIENYLKSLCNKKYISLDNKIQYSLSNCSDVIDTENVSCNNIIQTIDINDNISSVTNIEIIGALSKDLAFMI